MRPSAPPVLLALAILALPALTTPALASSDDAWAQFRTDVGAACLALVQGPGTAVVEVNGFGSEHYGVALVTLTTADAAETMVCIYDKLTKAAELSAPFDE